MASNIEIELGYKKLNSSNMESLICYILAQFRRCPFRPRHLLPNMPTVSCRFLNPNNVRIPGYFLPSMPTVNCHRRTIIPRVPNLSPNTLTSTSLAPNMVIRDYIQTIEKPKFLIAFKLSQSWMPTSIRTPITSTTGDQFSIIFKWTISRMPMVIRTQTS